MADGVYAAVDGVEPLAIDESLDLVSAEEEVEELPASYDAMLSAGQIGHDSPNLTFCRYRRYKVRFGGHARLSGRPG